ncbi:MAG TPA: retropepsin-like aspartic protease [Pyrinomonadaceae bacterium]|nr:retropepsin-like aspartic protease [Pyrinomonadaceae bacterium]
MTRGLLSLLLCCALGLAMIFNVGKRAAAAARPNTTVAEVPLKFNGPVPLVEVMVNGKGPFQFTIDTGGQGQARVDSSLVESLGLPKAGQVTASDGMGRNTRTLDTVKIESLKLGDAQFKNVVAVTRNYNENPRMPHIDGILGFGLFADYLLTLDYPAGRVRIERGELPQADGAEILSYEETHGTPSVELAFGDVKVSAHVDTGNMMGAIMLPSSVISKLTLASEPRVVGRVRTVTSTVEISEASVKTSMRLGRYEFAQPTVAFAEIFNDANLGLRLLKNFALTFDQKNHRVRFVKQAGWGVTGGLTSN